MKTLDEVAKESANEIWCDDTALENEQRELHGHFCGYTTAIKSDYNKALQIEFAIKQLFWVNVLVTFDNEAKQYLNNSILELQEQFKQLQP